MPEYIRKSKLTLGILAANIILFLLETIAGGSTDTATALSFGAYFYPLISVHHEWYRLFLPMFLHFGSTHLVTNMISLIAVGPYVEQIMGKPAYIFLYLFSGFTGNLVTYLYESVTGIYHVSAGASGSICGLLAAYLMFYLIFNMKKDRGGIRRILCAIACAILPGIEDASINLAAHIGGLIGGFLLTAVIIFIRRKNLQSAGL